MKTNKVPKYILAKIERMNKLSAEVTRLNLELEEWMESKGIENPFECLYDYRESIAYEITDVDRFISMMQEWTNA